MSINRPILLSAFVVALVSVLLAWGRPAFDGAEATGGGPQMAFGVVGDEVTCDAADQPTKCTAPFDSGDPKAGEFVLTVNATGIPEGGYGAFQVEVAGICSSELFRLAEEYGPWIDLEGNEQTGYAFDTGWPDCAQVDLDADTVPDTLLEWNPRAIDGVNDPDQFGPLGPTTIVPVPPLSLPDGIPDPLPNDTDSCEAEVVWPDLGALCTAFIAVNGQRRLGAASGLLPPLPASSFVGALVELDVHCPAAGAFSVFLTGFPRNEGALYTQPDGITTVPVKTVSDDQLDLTGVGAETVSLVDTLEINCEGPAGVTPTATGGPTITPGGPTATVGPTNTPTPAGPVGPVAIPTPCVGVCPQITLGAIGDVSCNDANNPTACRVSVPPGSDDHAGFTLTVNAGEIPSGGYGGFTLDLFFGGLEYQRESCSNEVIWPDEFFCLAFDGPGGQRQIRSGTGVFPPLPSSNYLGRLATFALRCPGLGQFMVTLTAAPSTPLGASYVDPNGATVFVDPPGQQFVDTDGDTVPEAVDAADALLINCRPPEGAGDVDGSGTVDSLDTLWLLWHIAGLRDDVPNPESMDVNVNGVIDAIDATLILQFAAGLIRSVSPGGPGDVNGDGITDNLDALWALWLLADIVDNVHSPEHMDVNEDGIADGIDVSLILQLDAGLIDSLSQPEGP